jgi:hypothetical protein
LLKPRGDSPGGQLELERSGPGGLPGWMEVGLVGKERGPQDRPARNRYFARS